MDAKRLAVPAAPAAGNSSPVFVVRDLVKSFNGAAVLKGVSFDVQPGEALAIIGPSGSGKSTLLKCLNFLEEYDSGEVRFMGQPVGYVTADGRRRRVRERSIDQLRSKLGMVFQNFELFPHMTVLQNLIEAPMRVNRERRADATMRARALLERVGLSDKAGVYPETLSGGEKQRAAIARALAMQPLAILWDEPTSALDPELVGEVLGLMTALATGGMTMIVVTHEMSFARDVADRVLIMDRGMIIEEGAPGAVFSNPRSERARLFLQRVLDH